MIHRSDKGKDSGNPYTRIDNRLLTDKTLSFGARGMLVYLLSKPDYWQVRNNDLYRQSADSKAQVDKFLKELRTVLYLVRFKVSEGRSKIDWVSEVYEVPVLNPAHPQFFFDAGLSDIENTSVEKHDIESEGHLVTTDSLQTTDLKTTEGQPDRQKTNELMPLDDEIISALKVQYPGIKWQHTRLVSFDEGRMTIGLFNQADYEVMSHRRDKIRELIAGILTEPQLKVEFEILSHE